MIRIPKQYEGREVLFAALYGSHNYNLAHKGSDYDYMMFLVPSFDDLYTRTLFSKDIVIDGCSVKVHDIRHLAHLWFKANINFIEVVYTRELIIPNEHLRGMVFSIFREKSRIVKMNLPYLWDACIGTYHTLMKKTFHQGTKHTTHLVEQYGYDTKAAMKVFRNLDFLERFGKQNFEYFDLAVSYTDTEREFMLSILNGKFEKTYMEELLKNKLRSTELMYKDAFKNRAPDEELREELEDYFKLVIKRVFV